jgi:hypothetical protein
MYMAGAAAKEGLPVPKLVFAVMPGGIASDEKSRGVQMGDLSKVDPSVSIVTIVGDREFQASDRLSRRNPARDGERPAVAQAVHARGLGRPRLPDHVGHARIARLAEVGIRSSRHQAAA